MEIRQCRGLARVTERVQDQPVGGGIGRTSGALKLLCGNTKSRKEEYAQQCDKDKRTRGQCSEDKKDRRTTPKKRVQRGRAKRVAF